MTDQEDKIIQSEIVFDNRNVKRGNRGLVGNKLVTDLLLCFCQN